MSEESVNDLYMCINCD